MPFPAHWFAVVWSWSLFVVVLPHPIPSLSSQFRPRRLPHLILLLLLMSLVYWWICQLLWVVAVGKLKSMFNIKVLSVLDVTYRIQCNEARNVLCPALHLYFVSTTTREQYQTECEVVFASSVVYSDAELPGMVALVSMVSTRYTCRTYSLLLRAPPLSDDDEKEENRFYRLTRTFINLLNYVLISYWYVMNLTPDTKFYAPILLYWHVLNLDEANNSTDID